MKLSKDDDELDMFIKDAKRNGMLGTLDDGHVPETFGKEPSQLLYRSIEKNSKRKDGGGSNVGVVDDNDNNMVEIYDNAISASLGHAIYESTIRSSLPWGTYVTIKEALAYADNDKKNDEDEVEPKKEEEEEEKERHEIAVAAVSSFLLHHVASSTVLPSQQQKQQKEENSSIEKNELWRSCLLEDAHGVAVWALASDVGSEVQYHMDYAELIRYERNVIFPPLLAATIHCTPFPASSTASNHTMQGGDFAVNLQGFLHYQQYGYKGRKQQQQQKHQNTLQANADNKTTNQNPVQMAGWTSPPPPSPSHPSYKIHYNSKTQWLTVPYLFCRGIVHTGPLPHLSTPILYLPSSSSSSSHDKPSTTTPTTTTTTTSSSIRRVILGLNVFGYEEGIEIQRAPEHSSMFRKRVKLQRIALSSTTTTDNNNNNNNNTKKFNLSAIQHNPTLRKLFILAKRRRIQIWYQQAQKQLTDQLIQDLLLHSNKKMTVLDLMHKPWKSKQKQQQQQHDNTNNVNDDDGNNDFLTDDSSWPQPNDVRVHLHHLIWNEYHSKSQEKKKKKNQQQQEEENEPKYQWICEENNLMEEEEEEEEEDEKRKMRVLTREIPLDAKDGLISTSALISIQIGDK